MMGLINPENWLNWIENTWFDNQTETNIQPPELGTGFGSIPHPPQVETSAAHLLIAVVEEAAGISWAKAGPGETSRCDKWLPNMGINEMLPP